MVFLKFKLFNIGEADCPVNQYKNENDRICYTTCPTSFYANKITITCTNSCPDGTYPDDISKECSFCHASCYTCTGPLNTNCINCYSFASLKSGACDCDLTYYGFTENVCNIPQSCFKCKKCFLGCSICEGSIITDCQSCIQNYFLTDFNSVFH